MVSYKVFLLAALLHLHIALNCSLREVKSISPPWRRTSELKNGGTRSRAKQYLHPTKYKVSFQQRNTFFTLQNIKIWNTKGRIQFACNAKYNLHSSLAPIGSVYNIRATFLPTNFLRGRATMPPNEKYTRTIGTGQCTMG